MIGKKSTASVTAGDRRGDIVDQGPRDILAFKEIFTRLHISRNYVGETNKLCNLISNTRTANIPSFCHS